MAIEEKMLELANRLPPSERRDRPLPDSVRAFLVESERRVLLHCRNCWHRKTSQAMNAAGWCVWLGRRRKNCSAWPPDSPRSEIA
jgi:hypothetical protein